MVVVRHFLPVHEPKAIQWWDALDRLWMEQQRPRASTSTCVRNTEPRRKSLAEGSAPKKKWQSSTIPKKKRDETQHRPQGGGEGSTTQKCAHPFAPSCCPAFIVLWWHCVSSLLVLLSSLGWCFLPLSLLALRSVGYRYALKGTAPPPNRRRRGNHHHPKG